MHHNRGLFITSLIWLVALATAFIVAGLRGFDWLSIWPYALFATVPALTAILLTPFMRKEWAQILVIFSWIALAITACVGLGFWPAAILFLCAPAAAALFEREKIIEALVLSGLFAAVIYYAGRTGSLPSVGMGESVKLWTNLAVPVGVVTFIMSALFVASHSEAEPLMLESDKTIPMNRSEVDVEMLDALTGGIVRLNGDDEITFVSMDAYDVFTRFLSWAGQTDRLRKS